MEENIEQERARWARSTAAAGAALQDSCVAVDVFAAENAALRAALESDVERGAKAVSAALGAAESAQSLRYAAEARADAAEASAAAAAAAAAAALERARADAALEISALSLALRTKTVEVEKLSDWAEERDALTARVAELEEALRAARDARDADVASLDRRNAADRVDARLLLLQQLGVAKRALVARTAASVDDTTRRIIAERGVLLDELVFTSNRAEALLAANTALETVRGGSAQGKGGARERSG